MTIFAKTISVLTLGISLLSISGLMSTSVEAALSDQRTYVVNTNKGVNIRNRDCKVVDIKTYGTVIQPLNFGSNETINCKINGRNYRLANLFGTDDGSEPSYIAQEFLSEVVGKGLEDTDYFYYMVNNSNGLNIRDENCKRIATVSNNTKLKKAGFNTNPPMTCKVGTTYYSMESVVYSDGTTAKWVASVFLK